MALFRSDASGREGHRGVTHALLIARKGAAFQHCLP
jgi:hypothetical protein